MFPKIGFGPCKECGSYNVRLVCFVGKNKKSVFFKVECDEHGGFSHMVPKTGTITRAVHRAVERMLAERAS